MNEASMNINFQVFVCVYIFFFMSPKVMSGSRLPDWCGKCMFIFKEPMNFPK